MCRPLNHRSTAGLAISRSTIDAASAGSLRITLTTPSPSLSRADGAAAVARRTHLVGLQHDRVATRSVMATAACENDVGRSTCNPRRRRTAAAVPAPCCRTSEGSRRRSRVVTSVFAQQARRPLHLNPYQPRVAPSPACDVAEILSALVLKSALSASVAGARWAEFAPNRNACGQRRGASDPPRRCRGAVRDLALTGYSMKRSSYSRSGHIRNHYCLLHLSTQPPTHVTVQSLLRSCRVRSEGSRPTAGKCLPPASR